MIMQHVIVFQAAYSTDLKMLWFWQDLEISHFTGRGLASQEHKQTTRDENASEYFHNVIY